MSNLVNKIRAARNICLVALALCTGNVLFAQTTQTVAVINPAGGIAGDFASGIALHIAADGLFLMQANGKGQALNGKSPSQLATLPNNEPATDVMGAHAVSLRLVGPSGTRTYGRRLTAPAEPMESVSQSGVTGTGTSVSPYQVVTTLRPSVLADSGIRVVITDRYVFPELKFTRKFEVTGLNSADIAKLYWSFDAYQGGEDDGMGYVDAAAGAFGAIGTYSLEKLQFVYNSAFPAWDRYESRPYGYAESQIPAVGDLGNTVDLTRHDTALAAQWNIPPNSTNYTTGVDLEYAPADVLATEKYTPSTVLVGDVSQMEILLTATGRSASTTGFTYDLPAGFRIAATPNLVSTCNPGATVSAAANSSTITVSTLPIPGASPALPYTCTITLKVESLVLGEHRPNFTSTSVNRSKSFYEQAALTVVTEVGVIKEVFSPALTRINQTSYFTITLENRTTHAQSGMDVTYDTFNPDLNVTSSIVSSTCGAPTMDVTDTEVKLSNISMLAAPSASMPSQCQITLATKGLQTGQYPVYFMGSNFGVGRDFPSQPTLNVVAPVNVDARFVPALITHPATSRFEMTLSNLDKSPFTSAAGFGYYMVTSAMNIAASPHLSSTCLPSGGTVTFDTTTYPGYLFINVTNLSLQAASATQPYTCSIALDVQSTSASQDTAFFDQQDPLISGNYTGISTKGSTGLSLVSALSKANIVPGEIVTVNMELTSALAQYGLAINYFFDGGGSNGANIELVGNSYTTTCPFAQLTQFAPPHPAGVALTNISVNANTPCQISFQITSQTPGLYGNYLGPTGSGWTHIADYYQPLYVFGGVPSSLPPQNGAVAAIPVASPYALLLTALSLLLAAGALMQGRKMQKPN